MIIWINSVFNLENGIFDPLEIHFQKVLLEWTRFKKISSHQVRSELTEIT